MKSKCSEVGRSGGISDLVVWLSGCLVVWLSGCLVVWLSGCLGDVLFISLKTPYVHRRVHP